jgi:hypothetical protein
MDRFNWVVKKTEKLILPAGDRSQLQRVDLADFRQGDRTGFQEQPNPRVQLNVLDLQLLRNGQSDLRDSKLHHRNQRLILLSECDIPVFHVRCGLALDKQMIQSTCDLHRFPVRPLLLHNGRSCVCKIARVVAQRERS